MIFPVILCGGSGTRLWPLSRSSYPKQFVNFEDGQSLFKDTVLRVSKIKGAHAPLVLCNENHRFYAKADLSNCNVSAEIIVEPIPRNTAPALALAAFAALSSDSEAILFVVPSDHSIKNEDKFLTAVSLAEKTSENDYLVTFGIKPNFPSTGFGYIEAGSELSEGVYNIVRYVEKPSKDKAEEFISSGNYLWNSGMFMFKASKFLEELRKFSPDIYTHAEKAWQGRKVSKDFINIDSTIFESCPSDSIDYAVMEKTKFGAMIPLNLEWNDLGSWTAFYNVGEKDSDKNVVKGDVILADTHNSYIHSTGRLISTIGLDNIAVIETKDSVLVSPLSRVQEVKKTVENLKKQGRPEAILHPLVYRPWGSYEGLAKGDRFQVKRIIVEPGEQLSLQLHYHRAEHWIIVQGTAEVQIGDSKELLSENQSTFIPLGTVHRLRNPGKVPLILIEVQSGSYLGEDDIVRLQDDYQRQ